ncbi:toprim domain-containing protein [Weissella minor]|uniref:toprim domain-containing protein n=1 Tax=Weissella minor TaxID=1620 RepID=UPI001BB09A20|nr:toprim domain-containing protein [Weissella minor]MBS0949229.1 toprim domain-containing protein [Weissella minor]
MSINRKSMKALPIQGYLDYAGIDYNVESHGRRIRLVEHDSLVIDTVKNRFIWNKTGDAGDLGDFIQAYEGVTSKEAWSRWAAYGREVKNSDEDVVDKYRSQVHEVPPFDFSKWKTSDTTRTAREYLVNKRGLDPDFVEPLIKSGYIQQGISVKDKQTNEWLKPPVLFPWGDENGKVVGLDQQGTSIDFEKYGKRGTEKRIAPGSQNEDYGYNFQFGNGSDKLVVFEAPIDLLSYAQQNLPNLKQENATLLSLSGTNSHKIWKQMDRMLHENGKVPGKVIVATDNDVAGFKVAQWLNRFESSEIEMVRQIPVEGKDWNDQLKSGKTGFTEMTLDESDRRLDNLLKLETQAKTASNNEIQKVNERKVGDNHAVGTNSSLKAQKSKAQNPDKILNRVERSRKIRQENEAIITQSLKSAQGVKNDPHAILKYLDFVAQGQAFSPRNSLIIKSQQPDASIVMGYNQFKANGLSVNKGETGAKILGAPITLKSIMTNEGEIVFLRDASPEQQAAAQKGELQTQNTKYYPIETVFDIRQTNATAEDIARLAPQKPINLMQDNDSAHIQQTYNVLKQQAAELGFKVFDENTTTSMVQRDQQLGRSKPTQSFAIADKKHPENNSIAIRDDLSEKQKVAELANQIGRVQMYTTAPKERPQSVKEAQANMTSYVLLRHLGVPAKKVVQEYMPDFQSQLSTLKDYPDNQHSLMVEVGQASSNITANLSNKLVDGRPKTLTTQTYSASRNVAQKQAEQTMQQQSNENTARTLSTGRSR